MSNVREPVWKVRLIEWEGRTIVTVDEFRRGDIPEILMVGTAVWRRVAADQNHMLAIYTQHGCKSLPPVSRWADKKLGSGAA